MTRIVSWNCNGKLAAKTDRLLVLEPDIAVVSECARDIVVAGDLVRVGWTGRIDHKGLAVFARPELGGRVDVSHDPTREFFLPVHFDALDSGLLAVWAMNQRGEEDRPKRGRTHDALRHYGDFLAAADLVIGDFNDNVRWDKPRYPAFATTTRMLSEAGFVNLYYLWTGEAPAWESIGTLYFHRHAKEPYVIDHAFLRRAQVAGLHDFSVGRADDWLDVSDHVPLVLELT